MNTDRCKGCGCDKRFFGCFCVDHSMSLNDMLSEEQLQRSRTYTQEMVARLEAIEMQPDFLTLWDGRPKDKPLKFKTGYVAVINARYAYNVRFDGPLINWNGLDQCGQGELK